MSAAYDRPQRDDPQQFWDFDDDNDQAAQQWRDELLHDEQAQQEFHNWLDTQESTKE